MTATQKMAQMGNLKFDRYFAGSVSFIGILNPNPKTQLHHRQCRT